MNTVSVEGWLVINEDEEKTTALSMVGRLECFIEGNGYCFIGGT